MISSDGTTLTCDTPGCGERVELMTSTSTGLSLGRKRILLLDVAFKLGWGQARHYPEDLHACQKHALPRPLPRKR